MGKFCPLRPVQTRLTFLSRGFLHDRSRRVRYLETYVDGFDISAAQGPNFPWGLVASLMPSVRFAYLQATQRDWKDSCFVRNCREAEHIGVLRGAYHVAHPALDAKKQAQLFYDTAYQASDLMPALDLELHKGHEEDPDQTPEQVREWTREWIEETKLLWQCPKVLLYSYPDYFNHWLRGGSEFDDCDFWWARYDHSSPEGCPKAPVIWQHDDGKRIKTPWGAGIDRDRFMGTEEEFQDWVGRGKIAFI